MSQIENVITTTFRARGGNVVAQLGSYAQGFGRLGNSINSNVRLSERLNNQWRAFGTTLRYAIAGGAIFGLTRLVGQLRDVNTQLGLMSAIGSGPSGIAYTSEQVDRLFEGLQTTAVKAILPLQQVNDAAVNFLSTVQNVPSSEIPAILTSIGQAATLAQTPVQDLTQAVTTANIAFGRMNNSQNIAQFSRMWYALISTAPGGIQAAPQIAQAMPALASMFQLAPGRAVGGKTGQAQMMSLILGALRTGMPPSTAMRGVTYLLQSLAQPTGGARQALAGIGITPQFVQEKGIYAAVMRLLTTVTKTGNPKALAQIPDETLDALDESGGNLPGIPANEMIRLRKMVPRIHGIRAAIILASQLQAHGDVTSLQQNLENMLKAQDDQAVESQNMAEAWKRFSTRAKLQQATVAINAMGLQVASMFNPILNYASKNIVFGAMGLQHHRDLAKGLTYGAGGFLTAIGLGRFLGVGNMRAIRNLPGAGLLRGGVGGGFIAAQAVESAISGGTGLGATPQNPLYVIVVGTIFGGAVAGGAPTVAPGGGGGGKSWLSKVWTGLQLGIGGAYVAPYLGAALRGATKGVGWLGAEMPAVGDVLNDIIGARDTTTGQPLHTKSLWNRLWGQGDFKSWQDYHQALARAQKLYPGTTGIEDYRKGMLKGRAEIYMTLDITDASGKTTRKKVHVPVDIASGGRVPTYKGKPASGTRG